MLHKFYLCHNLISGRKINFSLSQYNRLHIYLLYTQSVLSLKLEEGLTTIEVLVKIHRASFKLIKSWIKNDIRGKLNIAYMHIPCIYDSEFYDFNNNSMEEDNEIILKNNLNDIISLKFGKVSVDCHYEGIYIDGANNVVGIDISGKNFSIRIPILRVNNRLILNHLFCHTNFIRHNIPGKNIIDIMSSYRDITIEINKIERYKLNDMTNMSNINNLDNIIKNKSYTVFNFKLELTEI